MRTIIAIAALVFLAGAALGADYGVFVVVHVALAMSLPDPAAALAGKFQEPNPILHEIVFLKTEVVRVVEDLGLFQFLQKVPDGLRTPV